MLGAVDFPQIQLAIGFLTYTKGRSWWVGLARPSAQENNEFRNYFTDIDVFEVPFY